VLEQYYSRKCNRVIRRCNGVSEPSRPRARPSSMV
jgi:hypothetical protein